MIHWERLRGARPIAALVSATALGAGLVPLAPGTAGAAVALPIAYLTDFWPLVPRVALWLAITIVGTWASKVFDEINGTDDNQNIVIDEVLGCGIAAWTAGTDWKALLAAFVLFRIFDVLKPPPVRQADRWTKGKGGWWGAFGVMGDDLLAGLQALAVMIVLQHFGVL